MFHITTTHPPCQMWLTQEMFRKNALYIQEQTEVVLVNSVFNCQNNLIQILYSHINMKKLCSVIVSRK